MPAAQRTGPLLDASSDEQRDPVSPPTRPLTDGHLQVARVFHGTTAEGPGLRTAVWFQGCSIQCKGCINPHLFNPRGGTRTPIAELVEQAVAAGVEGLTLIGGEPFDQPVSGAALASTAQERGLGVIAFSGYEYESLLDRDDDTKAFLAATDLLVDGPYQAETRKPTAPWWAPATNASSISPNDTKRTNPRP
ncbi:anaerobic ribonucleoside-triphosphate reductase-activating protein [Arthrobacter sp. Hiyo4]|nr:anaerobic ribonucleoside-triphosphate reductase-activating protein [Arthrobacter sp. Hiyo4]